MGNIVAKTVLLLFGSGAILEINAKSGTGLPQSMQQRWLSFPDTDLEGASRRSSWARSYLAWGTDPCWALGGWLARRTSGALTWVGSTNIIYEV